MAPDPWWPAPVAQPPATGLARRPAFLRKVVKMTENSEAEVQAQSFPPIAEYGFLSDCENNCLVAPDGSVEWLCLPRPDSASVFGALLDRAAGSFRFGPNGTHVPQHRRYVPGTMVLETTWQTPTGWMTVHDLLAIGATRNQ